ncbi:glycogen/starch synthase [Achromobacter xylosoxidans]
MAAEAFPLAKTGGLGDAITGMARALAQAHMQPTLLLPAYRGVAQRLRPARPVADLAGLPGGDARLLAGSARSRACRSCCWKTTRCTTAPACTLTTTARNMPTTRCATPLAHAAVRIAQGLPGLPRPELVHAHDWHAALTPLLLRAAGVTDVKSVLTIHNLAFQGPAALEDAPLLGVPAPFLGEDGAQAWGRLNFMKAGIRYADRVTTVSHRYAREILTPNSAADWTACCARPTCARSPTASTRSCGTRRAIRTWDRCATTPTTWPTSACARPPPSANTACAKTRRPRC